MIPYLAAIILLMPLIDALNVLVYSPTFAGSHMNFMGTIADTLTDAGHNVTFLVPVADDTKKTQFGVQSTKSVILVELADELRKKQNVADDFLGAAWLAETTPESMDEGNRWFTEMMVNTYRNLLQNREALQTLASIKYDVFIAEPMSQCGIAIAWHLGITKQIIASSPVLLDFVLPLTGEPEELSYVPSFASQSADRMSIVERYQNLRFSMAVTRQMTRLFAREHQLFGEIIGGDLPRWQDLFAIASIIFTNSNAFLDFPRPVIQKTVPIGGIAMDLDKIRATTMSKEWDEVLNRRPKTMLVSFGTMTKSSVMPNSYRQNLLNVFASFAKVTFIWKYETDDLEWANGVDNIHFSKWVPQPALLADHRLSAFLTHGGLGSTNELAYSGKPAITVPVLGDQMRNSLMLARHESSIIIRHKSQLENFAIMKEAIEQILFNETFAINAQRLAAMLQNQPLKPKELVVKYVEFVGNYGPLTKLDPYSRQLNYFQRTMLDIYLLIGSAYFVVFSVVLYVLYKAHNFLRMRLLKSKSE
ncbi:unnamed protein product [Caenorhabditis bovis]|uniref:UDP-glucuronosyltransferase n=1 Tax=Caenorhabditis bovis TaxID=2654633 RepID=A0A8S1F9X6_9PELO|nr:unnamed protein product [Caenorhabditis bovis]